MIQYGIAVSLRGWGRLLNLWEQGCGLNFSYYLD